MAADMEEVEAHAQEVEATPAEELVISTQTPENKVSLDNKQITKTNLSS